MKYWILTISLFILGCGSGESDGVDAMSTEEVPEETADTVGEEISDTLHAAEDAARDVGDELQKAKDNVDDAVDEAEGKVTE